MTFTYLTRVYYEDTDCGGVVYHANYLKFMERARSEWLLDMGWDMNLSSELDRLFVVKSVQMDLIKPARLYDDIQVDTKVARNGRSFIDFEQIVSNGEGVIYCKAIVRAVCVNHAFRPCAMPKVLLKEIKHDG
ncbi:MAG: YbgC/FadM family acyl-CoA thioesterase [Gammaproteobacteria bacterium]|nr:YbgC/FadM family acyl-CoA thioesterase [Gammaproteobacteria bacterium]MBU2545664.1 YbgC/FadM family acyl-CoA thioesterase [Gammaproteobacteria bacterium]